MTRIQPAANFSRSRERRTARRGRILRADGNAQRLAVCQEPAWRGLRRDNVTRRLEGELDDLVYALYELTTAERILMEPRKPW